MRDLLRRFEQGAPPPKVLSEGEMAEEEAAELRRRIEAAELAASPAKTDPRRRQRKLVQLLQQTLEVLKDDTHTGTQDGMVIDNPSALVALDLCKQVRKQLIERIYTTHVFELQQDTSRVPAAFQRAPGVFQELLAAKRAERAGRTGAPAGQLPGLKTSQSAPVLPTSDKSVTRERQELHAMTNHTAYMSAKHDTQMHFHQHRVHLRGMPERTEERRLEAEDAMAERVRAATEAHAKAEAQRQMQQFSLLSKTARRLPRWYTSNDDDT